MDFTYESVVFFLTIIFLSFCCGLLRSLRQYFNKTNGTDVPVEDNILVTHIRLHRTSDEVGEHDSVSSVFPGGPPSPPPYSVVSNDTSFMANIPPPSYDDVLKQMNTSPKGTDPESAPR
ncbi:hypothetical protein CBL_04471 [Carabus blaptoides fortunei]